MKRNYFLILILCLFGCGGGSDSPDFKTWQGPLVFKDSVCDIVQSEPPFIDSSILEVFLIEMGEGEGDSVRLIAFGSEYEGQMTGADSFSAYLVSEDSDLSKTPTAITGSNIGNNHGAFEVSFTFDAPHGCTHTFAGVFEML